MFDSLPVVTQFVLIVIGIALLFLYVFSNSKKNKEKLYKRKRRDFRKNYYERKDNDKNQSAD